jgi:WD40 repeat protein
MVEASVADESNTVRWDFFISYTQADRTWAEWIAWHLEAAGFRVLVQVWDMVPGVNWMKKMQDGVIHSDRTIAILSSSYLKSVYGQQEWLAAFQADPQGFTRKLVPVRIEDCDRPGILGQIVSFDLIGLDNEAARTRLLHQIDIIRAGRAKPVEPPAFPAPALRNVSAREQPVDPNVDSPWRRPPERVATLTDHRSPVLAMDFSPAGRLLATASDSGALLWDTTAIPPAPIATLEDNSLVPTVAFSSDGGLLAMGMERYASIWNLKRTRPVLLTSLTVREAPVGAVRFSPDGRVLATGSDDGSVRLWDIGDPTQPSVAAEVIEHSAAVLGVAFSPDGRVLVTAGDDCVAMLWDVSDAARPFSVGALTDHLASVFAVAFSPDGRLLATASESLRLWNMNDPGQPRLLAELSHNGGLVGAAAFSPDSRMMATGDENSAARIWDLNEPTKPRVVAELADHRGSISAIAFSPDGQSMATGSFDRTVTMWSQNPSAPTVTAPA